MQLTDAQLKQLHARYTAGATLTDLAHELPISDRTLAARFKAAGLPVRKRTNKRAATITDEQLKQLHARYTAGEQLGELAREIKCAHSTLSNRFKAAGLPVRGRKLITPAQRRKIWRLTNMGFSRRIIAQKVGCSRSTVDNVLAARRTVHTCDCGKEAVTTKKVAVGYGGGTIVKLRLCANCLEIEKEMRL